MTAALEAEKERLAREEEAQEEQGSGDRVKVPEGVDEEWLPAGALGGKGGKAARRRKK